MNSSLRNAFKLRCFMGLAILLCTGVTIDVAAAGKLVPEAFPISDADTASVANNILNRWEPVAEAARERTLAWRDVFRAQLNQMSPRALHRLDALTVDAASDAKSMYARFMEAFVSAQMNTHLSVDRLKPTTKSLGSATVDQVFVPIPPCRVVDTRPSSGGSGPIGPGSSTGFYQTFYIYSADASWSWSSQGGFAGAANIACPGTALNAAGGTLGLVKPSAAMATVTAVGPTTAGNLLIWGGNGTAPNSSALNFNAFENIANTTVIPIGTRVFGVNNDFAILYNGPSGQTNVVVDVIGYFVENGATALQCNLQTASGPGFSDFQTGTNLKLNFPGCTTGYNATGYGCGYNGSIPSGVYLQEVTPSFGYCDWFNNSGTTQSTFFFEAETRCCRVPGQ
jgi:hypothetical protein